MWPVAAEMGSAALEDFQGKGKRSYVSRATGNSRRRDGLGSPSSENIVKTGEWEFSLRRRRAVNTGTTNALVCSKEWGLDDVSNTQTGVWNALAFS